MAFARHRYRDAARDDGCGCMVAATSGAIFFAMLGSAFLHAAEPASSGKYLAQYECVISNPADAPKCDPKVA